MNKFLPEFLVARLIAGILLLTLAATSQAQSTTAVTGIITDFQGYWKSTAAAPHATYPDNSHNLLAFTYHGVQYSTGVDDSKLSGRGEDFNAQDFWSLPVTNMSGTVSGNTKVGFGALYDGVYNGPSNPAPEAGLLMYLTDGIKGLNIGTCVANLPAGSMNFSLSNIQPASIGDGVPDILVTQIADPSGSSDRYEFIDQNGLRVGNALDIVFTNIAPVGTWVADFYTPGNPLTLQPGFTQTTRPLRLWAADLSEFGITAQNYTQIRNFRINLSGNSDVAFVAYNNRSVRFQTALPVRFSGLFAQKNNAGCLISWQTGSELNTTNFVVERSVNGGWFEPLGRVLARGSGNPYRFTDPHLPAGTVLYRIRSIDVNGQEGWSHTVRMESGKELTLRCSPNPVRGRLTIEYPTVSGQAQLLLCTSTGQVVQRFRPNEGLTLLDTQTWAKGIYHLVLVDADLRMTTSVIVQ